MTQQFKLDDHSELVPLLPIPNRTVKRLSADDSADSRVKVGHRQATYKAKPRIERSGAFVFGAPYFWSFFSWLLVAKNLRAFLKAAHSSPLQSMHHANTRKAYLQYRL